MIMTVRGRGGNPETTGQVTDSGRPSDGQIIVRGKPLPGGPLANMANEDGNEGSVAPDSCLRRKT